MWETETVVDEVFIATFKIGDEHFGLETSNLHEMVRLSDLTLIASAPPFLMGIMNLRGKMVNIVDLSTKLEMGKCQPCEETRVMIVSYDSCLVGLCVDSLEDIFPLAHAEVLAAPSHLEGARQRCIKSILVHQNKKYALLQLNALLDSL